MTDEELFKLSFEERAEKLLSRVFRGMHHVHDLKKSEGYWSCVQPGGFSTFDFDDLTRLVLAAHEYCVRVNIGRATGNALKVTVSRRDDREGNFSTRHPTIEQAIEAWRTQR